MRKIHLLMFVCLGAFAQQPVETVPLRAVLSSASEVPPPGDLNASGTATVWLHLVRDANGQISSGSVDFNVNYAFPGAVTITGLHINPGAAGVAGPVVIGSGLTSGAPVNSSDGSGVIRLQGQVGSDNTDGLRALNSLLADPAQFYVNLHTNDNPGGAIRGQLQRADMAVLMAVMSPRNETPNPPDASAAAVATVIALRTPDSGQVIFDVNYTLPAQAGITGLHIHPGAAGDNGPVTAKIGGQDAEVLSSVAAPGFLGLYQTAARIPDGLAQGNVPVTLSIGGATSNTVSIAVE